MRHQRVVGAVVVLTALSMLYFGVWARWDPAGFAQFTNWPNHIHFLHDAGVFQIGIGLMMLAALFWHDTITVVLGGFVLTNTFHAINHALDMDIGGNASDPWILSLLSAIATVGLILRLRWLRRQRRQRGTSSPNEQEVRT